MQSAKIFRPEDAHKRDGVRLQNTGSWSTQRGVNFISAYRFFSPESSSVMATAKVYSALDSVVGMAMWGNLGAGNGGIRGPLPGEYWIFIFANSSPSAITSAMPFARSTTELSPKLTSASIPASRACCAAFLTIDSGVWATDSLNTATHLPFIK